MFGAETILMNRCKNEELFEQTVHLINDFKEYFLSHGEPVGENPSPGNKAGGISTLEEKALGCTQKCGKSFDAIGALQFRLLGNEERDASFFQAGDIPFQKVIAYQIEIFLSATLQVFADEDNEMLDEFFRTYPTVKNGITFNSKAYIVVAFGMQVELQYSTRRMMFFHVLPETDFSVLLLVRT